jgi:antiviral helicase SLH1
MSPALEDLQAQWLSQMAEMRAAISELNLTEKALSQDKAFGDDIQFTNDDFKFNSGSDDIWDSIGDDSEIDSELEHPNGAPIYGGAHNREWLSAQCCDISRRNPDIEPEILFDQIIAVLSSDSSDDELQMLLIDILGLDELDLAADIIRHRRDILKESIKPEVPSRSGVLAYLQTKAEREETLRLADLEHKNAILAPAQSRQATQYPHVYKAHDAGNTLSAHGRSYVLPLGSQRFDREKYEEYSIPATKVGILAQGEKLVLIKDMDGLCRRTFAKYKSLNRMQSLVYPVAYKTSENMLICAPTGAGKTDAALLTILSTITKNIIPNPLEDPNAQDFAVQTDNFKVVYIAPMKALAAEVTEKMGKRLAWLGIKCRELTGDMQLTRSEIAETQIIVTTPEKWDVVTRKSTGDTELVQKVRLLIIDEVHMLHDERGAVLESLVARTQRQVESTQSLIRIVGLSATLPNYVDVSDFLHVNRMAGLFYFDASFRPVPLEQHFLGVKGKAASKQYRENLDLVAFEKIEDMLRQGHQVMVFVHSRKDTLKSANDIWKGAADNGIIDLLDPQLHPRYDMAIRDVKSSKSRELRELIPKGLGTHHAGMPRTDRNLVERLFADGVLKVLCCTATLAWGVNLPAAAVIIKGTEVYSAEAGKFVDVGILDVLQIFGRAGRPQFQDSGIGFIVTSHDKLQHYLTAVTQQQPIESNFSKKLVDNLNAEVALGTVTSVQEGVQWLGYSYLFIRMQKSPLNYGIEWSEIRDDPQLVQRRRKLIINAARILQKSQMIIFNETTEELRSKDVGRIASQYYVLETSIDIFNKMMRPRATEGDSLSMISMSGEFDQIQSRESEQKELKAMMEWIPAEIKGGIDSPHAKTNILLQSYISKFRPDDYTLVSDSAYVAQNSARICRALFMIALNRKWGHQCLVLLSLCKSIEKQLWPYQHPLNQFDLPIPVLKHLDDKYPASSVENLRDMTPSEVGGLVQNQKMGSVIKNLLKNFPTVSIEAEIAPLNRDVLRVKLYLTPDFSWNDRHHGKAESYWIWVENSETSEIYHHEYFLLTRKKMYDDHEIHFTIPLSDPLPSQIYVRAVSDRWLGAETVTPVSFQHLIRPDTESVYTDLLNLQPLSINALKNPALEEIYSKRFEYFNPMQTQLFHCMYYTSANVLLGSPTGSGKTVAAELAMWWAFREHPGSKVVYIAPMKALVKERVLDWGRRLAPAMGLKLVELTGDNTPDTRTIRNADIIITTPEKWDGISRSWQTRGYVQQVSLVIIDEIHLLGGDRGPVLEIIVSRMNYIASQKGRSIRLVGMSTACANATDLANWLGVKEGLFNFRPSVRPVPLEIYIDGFPEQRGFCPLMQSMNRPTFLAIKSHSPDKPVIVFVASRRQTRLTARDLIHFCGMEENPRRFLHMSEEDLALNLSRAKDENMKEALGFGIGLHHAGLVESDRLLAEELFANNKIQVLVATSTLAWGVNLPAHLVVVKGTQFFDAKTEAYKDMDLTDVLQMLGRAGRPQFDDSGVARIFTQDAKKAFYKHFLHTGFPVESSLHLVLANHIGAEISAETIATKQDALDYLTWTFFFRRLHKNPTYYGLEISPDEHNTTAAQDLANEYMVNLVDETLQDLGTSSCAEILPTGEIFSTPFGKIMSYYYLSHKTIRMLLTRTKPNPSFEDVLTWLSLATEFDELPVRHNEDLINAELAKNLRFKPTNIALPMWDPHIKAFLLLQTHFDRIPLPITDYVGDQTSVLDQSVRVCQAAIDVLAEKGLLDAVKMMINLMQCIKSARWPTDGPLAIYPGIDVERENSRVQDGKIGGNSLSWFTNASDKEVSDVVKALHISRRDSTPFYNAIKHLPRLDLTVSNVSTTGFELNIARKNPLQVADARMYAPKFPKKQTERFFLLVSKQGTNELIALKRIGWPSGIRGKPTVKTTVSLPLNMAKSIVEVSVVSDGYIGLEMTNQIS